MSESEALSHIVTIGGEKYHKYTGNAFAEAVNYKNSSFGGQDDYFVEHKPFYHVGDKVLKKGFAVGGPMIVSNYFAKGIGTLWYGFVAKRGLNILMIW
ncbi:hypothetical protein [Sphingobacterium lactis]|uniref:hypothetical protein n=1 Tax=Sphingobacterium lactis TaxID=797291 RepID=UPI003DA4C3CF